MKKNMLVLAMSLIVVSSAGATQAPDVSAGLDLSRFSVQAGLGFFSEDNFDGFMINFNGNYQIDDHWSAGADVQLGFDTDFLLVSMPFYGRYDFGDLPVDVPFLSMMHPFAKLGMGFTYAEFDFKETIPPLLPGFPSTTIEFKFDDVGFLFTMAGGLAYPINENFSLESTMQFNITTNDLFADDFYFSWELISLRYTF